MPKHKSKDKLVIILVLIPILLVILANLIVDFVEMKQSYGLHVAVVTTIIVTALVTPMAFYMFLFVRGLIRT